MCACKDAGAMEAYYKDEMPNWVAVPFDFEGRKDIKGIHDVQGIPCLAVFNAEGKRIAENGRQAVHQGVNESKQIDIIHTWAAN